jgi:hypothetical protein
MSDRCIDARQSRLDSAEVVSRVPWPDHVNNGEEGDYPYLANYSKGLPHNDVGEVDPAAYNTLLRALSTQDNQDFERVPAGVENARKLVNPQSGLAFDTEGPDAQSLIIPPAPRIDGARNSAEMVELYWMALTRDVPFIEFEDHPLIAEAAAELSDLSDYRGPKVDGRVTPRTLFRGDARGDVRGPYLSQFLLRDIQYGTLRIPQRHDTVVPDRDYLVKPEEWLAVQRGRQVPAEERNQKDRRFLRQCRADPARPRRTGRPGKSLRGLPPPGRLRHLRTAAPALAGDGGGHPGAQGRVVPEVVRAPPAASGGVRRADPGAPDRATGLQHDRQ